jgi:hypothetical protein
MFSKYDGKNNFYENGKTIEGKQFSETSLKNR